MAESARSLGLNMSRLAEAAISEAAKVERNRRWREENSAPISLVDLSRGERIRRG